jgi:hypothetical protein
MDTEITKNHLPALSHYKLSAFPSSIGLVPRTDVQRFLHLVVSLFGPFFVLQLMKPPCDRSTRRRSNPVGWNHSSSHRQPVIALGWYLPLIDECPKTWVVLESIVFPLLYIWISHITALHKEWFWFNDSQLPPSKSGKGSRLVIINVENCCEFCHLHQLFHLLSEMCNFEATA